MHVKLRNGIAASPGPAPCRTSRARRMGACCSSRRRSPIEEKLIGSPQTDGQDLGAAGDQRAALTGPASTAAAAGGADVQDCPFCAIARGRADQDKIFWQSERLVVFRDRSPAAACHLQVVPRWHIKNLDALQPSAEDHALVLEMLEAGRQALQQLHPGARHLFGFHVPPFNSVLHLHMHALALPFCSEVVSWKYRRWGPAPWWTTAEEVLAQLEPAAGSAAASAASTPPKQR